MKKISYREFRFLIFFIPIFVLKLMNITADNKILVIVSASCFLSEMFGLVVEKMPKIQLSLFFITFLYTALLVITSGKQGAFFSIVIILGLYGINPYKHVYKYCWWIGVVFVIISCYIERTGSYGMRYINGTWTSMYKRSNILYISFFAVLCLYLYLQKECKVRANKLVGIWLLGYAMYRYTGSRTGFLVLNILVILLIAFKNKLFQKTCIVKIACVNSPIIAFILSYFMAFYYGKIQILSIVNSTLQGRLELGQRYLNRYSLKLFGQHIYENFSADDFWCLDCAYLDMLICYGIIFAIIWVLLTRNVLKWLYEEKRYIEVATIVAYSVYGISETFLSNGFLNVSIFLYAEYIFSHVLKQGRGNVNGKSKNNCDVFTAIP